MDRLVQTKRRKRPRRNVCSMFVVIYYYVAIDTFIVDEIEDADEESVMRMMGFAGFTSTKGKKIEGNDVSGTNIKSKNRYR